MTTLTMNLYLSNGLSSFLFLILILIFFVLWQKKGKLTRKFISNDWTNFFRESRDVIALIFDSFQFFDKNASNDIFNDSWFKPE